MGERLRDPCSCGHPDRGAGHERGIRGAAEGRLRGKRVAAAGCGAGCGPSGPGSRRWEAFAFIAAWMLGLPEEERAALLSRVLIVRADARSMGRGPRPGRCREQPRADSRLPESPRRRRQTPGTGWPFLSARTPSLPSTVIRLPQLERDQPARRSPPPGFRAEGRRAGTDSPPQPADAAPSARRRRRRAAARRRSPRTAASSEGLDLGAGADGWEIVLDWACERATLAPEEVTAFFAALQVDARMGEALSPVREAGGERGEDIRQLAEVLRRLVQDSVRGEAVVFPPEDVASSRGSEPVVASGIRTSSRSILIATPPFSALSRRFCGHRQRPAGIRCGSRSARQRQVHAPSSGNPGLGGLPGRSLSEVGAASRRRRVSPAFRRWRPALPSARLAGWRVRWTGAGVARSSQPGSHQFARPDRCIRAGTRRVRRMKASSRTAAAMPRPISPTTCWPERMNAPNTRIMMVAAG